MPTDGPATCSLPIPEPASPADVLRLAAEALGRGRDACLATVLSSSGSCPSTAGQKLVLCSDGSAAGTVGGGGVEHAVIGRMQAMLADGPSTPVTISFQLARDLAMACGGSVELLIEPLLSAMPVLMVGAGHVGLATARLLSSLGFRVSLVDVRPSAFEPSRLQGCDDLHPCCGTPESAPHGVPKRGAVVVATHDHALDQDALIWAVEEGYAYVGGVGSRAKALKLKQALSARGLPDDRVARVRMPIGVSIGARQPTEIAVSIAAELIAWRAGAPTP